MPTMIHDKRARADALTAAALLGTVLAGCGPRLENHPPPASSAVAGRIQNNPHIPPALRQQMMDNARARAQQGQARGLAAQRALSGH